MTTFPTSKSSACRRRLKGRVVSTKMAKTCVVQIDRRVPHKKYGKYRTVSTKLKVHDEKSLAKVGDFVSIEETRPLSKDKRWRLIEVLKPAQS
jgi:small subunit ribosomal protein S17